jgi:hypothetical protein
MAALVFHPAELRTVTEEHAANLEEFRNPRFDFRTFRRSAGEVGGSEPAFFNKQSMLIPEYGVLLTTGTLRYFLELRTIK